MINGVTITTSVRSRKGPTILWVNLPPNFQLEGPAVTHRLGEELIKNHEKVTGENPSCVVVIESLTAGTFLAKALKELYDVLAERGGRLLCVNYPEDYVDPLTAFFDSPPPLFGSLSEALASL